MRTRQTKDKKLQETKDKKRQAKKAKRYLLSIIQPLLDRAHDMVEVSKKTCLQKNLNQKNLNNSLKSTALLQDHIENGQTKLSRRIFSEELKRSCLAYFRGFQRLNSINFIVLFSNGYYTFFV
jgi:hypothetical protein